MELFVQDIAVHRPVLSAGGFGVRVFATQIDDIDVLSREVIQRFGEQRPRGHVGRGERIARSLDLFTGALVEISKQKGGWHIEGRTLALRGWKWIIKNFDGYGLEHDF